MKNLMVGLAAMSIVVAGCSSSDDKPDLSPTSASAKAAEDELREQTKKQAEQAQAAQDELSEEVARKAAEAQGTVVKIAIKDGKATPQGDRVEVKVGDKVTFEMSSDAAEEIHVHSDPEHSYELVPGETVTESFTLKRPGQVAVEAHHLGVTIVQLVVRP